MSVEMAQIKHYGEVRKRLLGKPTRKQIQELEVLKSQIDALQDELRSKEESFNTETSLPPPVAYEIQPASEPTCQNIKRAVCNYYNISLKAIECHRREFPLVRHRQVCMYLCYKHTDKSFPFIGRLLGGRDHTTILHGVRRIKKLMEEDSELKFEISAIEKSLEPKDE